MNHFSERNIVCREFRLLYFHVPKAACTTLKYALARMNRQIRWASLVDRTLFLDKYSRRFRRYWHHLVHFGIAHPCVPRADVLTADYDGWFKFAFFRNPWSRLYSCYSNKVLKTPVTDNEYVRGVTKGFVKYGFYCGMPFREFAERVCEIPDEQASSHFGSQTYYVGADVFPRLDFVGRFENLGHDFGEVCARAGIPQAYRLPHLTSTATRDAYRVHYSDELRVKVARRFAQDLDLLKYTFASSEDRPA